jgi:N-acetylglucosamine-6-sulfatase
MKNIGDLTAADETTDADGDGFRDLAEYQSMTNPLSPSTPNIVVMVSDDHRHDALGVVQKELGEKANFPFFESPQFDRLAGGGIRFRNAFVTHSLCSPSRATMLSGLHTHAHGITFNEQPFVSRETWPHLLADGGWKTGYFGKWHMGNQRERPGFQESATFLNQGVYLDCKFIVNGRDTPSSGWVDDVSTGYAIDFIRRNKDRRFAVCLGFKAPHDKRTPPERHAGRYSGVKLAKPGNWDAPAPWIKTAGRDWAQRLKDRIAYFQTLRGVDDNVGRVLDVLDELKLAGDTLVLYMGDNGYYLGEHGLGDKRTAYEESIRIPFILRYPGAAKPGVRDELVLNLDVAATILDACGLRPTWKQHGASLMPLGGAPGAVPWRKSFLYQNYRDPAYPKVTFDVLAVRTETHKYVENNHNPEWTQLFLPSFTSSEAPSWWIRHGKKTLAKPQRPVGLRDHRQTGGSAKPEGESPGHRFLQRQKDHTALGRRHGRRRGFPIEGRALQRPYQSGW